MGQPILKLELHAAARAMAKEKAPRPNGFGVEFFTKFWHLIGIDFADMIQATLAKGELLYGMNKGLIALL